MDSKTIKGIKQLAEDSSLRLFVDDDLGFYKKYFGRFNAAVIREKKILEFENPNRMKVTYEYDVQGLEVSSTPLFVFLPKTRKNWLKIYWEGKRLPVIAAEVVKKNVWEVVGKDVSRVSEELGEEDEVAYWERKVWGGRTQLPCFVSGEHLSGDGQLVVEYYDSFEHFEHIGCLFDERRYKYHYALEAGTSHWLYVKAPEKFQIEITANDKRANLIKGNDPEIKAYRIFHGTENEDVVFTVDVKVPGTLKLWYGSLVGLGVVFVIALLSIGITLIATGNNLTPVFAQVGISIVAAVIATRGWMMTEETVLKRVSNILTILAILILTCLVALYSVSSFVVVVH